MSSEQFWQEIQTIRQRMASWPRTDPSAWHDMDMAIDNLHIAYEEIQTSLQIAELTEQALLQQNQSIAAGYQHYHDLFDAAPIAYIVTDATGLILEGNQAMGQLLNVPQQYLAGKSLIFYVAESDHPAFFNYLTQLSQSNDIQIWRLHLRLQENPLCLTEWSVATGWANDGQIESLRIGIYNVSDISEEIIGRHQQPVDVVSVPLPRAQLPQPLDGLRVLVVDDETDIREFITAVLEAHGIGVRTVASAAAALEELERFRPDVLLCDLRMPGEDGYSLIRRVRALEAKQGGHLPAAAITAYLDEDREKALQAGFEAHLYKLVQPSEWVQMVIQLATQTSSQE